MLKPFHGFACITLGIVAACSVVPGEEESEAVNGKGDPAVSVTAVAETVPVGTANEDAADDPAIWLNAADPAKSLIVATDKKAGLHVYNLAGEDLHFLNSDALNNVDLVELADGTIVVLASDRKDEANAHVFVATLNPAEATLTELGRFPTGAGEGYGICVGEADGNTIPVFSAPKEGNIYRLDVTIEGALASANFASELTSVPSQPEGCVVDTRSNTLYIGEEAAGIWAINIESGEKELVAKTGTGMIVPDLEGLALAPEGEEGGYLVASSQGDNAYAVYALPALEPVGRFRIGEGEYGSTEETDGIALDARAFGDAFPSGLFIAQDGQNGDAAQNFKLVRWGDVLSALEAGQAE